MLVAFTIHKDNQKYRFRATDVNKYKRNTSPHMVYYCNNKCISRDDYTRNLNGYLETRK